MITYSVEGVRMPAIKKRATNAWIKAVAASYGRKVGEIGYLFVNDEKILEVLEDPSSATDANVDDDWMIDHILSSI